MVVFEAIPAKSKWDEYLNIAAELKAELSNINGFISIERFQSINNPEKVVSISFWEDEQSIEEWRNIEMHRRAQKKGRDEVFLDYQLSVAIVIRRYSMIERTQAPEDSKLLHNKSK